MTRTSRRVHLALAAAGLFLGAALAAAWQLRRPFPARIWVTLSPPAWVLDSSAVSGIPVESDALAARRFVIAERTALGFRSTTMAAATSSDDVPHVRERAPASLWSWARRSFGPASGLDWPIVWYSFTEHEESLPEGTRHEMSARTATSPWNFR